MENVYIALIVSTVSGFDLSQYNLVIGLFNSQYPNNTLVIDEYLVDGSEQQTILALESFLQKYPLGKRVTVSSTSSVLTFLSNYITNNNLPILNLSFNASSNYLQNLNNIITYSPFNQYGAMSMFLVYKDYQMNEISILYEKNTKDDLFFNDYLDQITQQAILLNIKVTVQTLQVGKTNYNIKPKSMIIMLATTNSLTNIYVNKDFLYNIPMNSFILLTNINSTITDIFEHVPTIGVLITNINYTSQTDTVYQVVKNNPTGFNYTSYAFYDILFVLNYFTNTPIPITKNNYITVNPYNATLPAWLLNTNIIDNLNGSPYGNYAFIFTKNVIINKDQDIFIKYYRGGQNFLPNSYSLLRIAGLTPNNESLINYDEAEYYKIYDKYCNKILVRYSSDITEFPPEINNTFLNVGIAIETKFIYSYNLSGYFIVLKRLFPPNCKIPTVSPTMGKIPIKLKYTN